MRNDAPETQGCYLFFNTHKKNGLDAAKQSVQVQARLGLG